MSGRSQTLLAEPAADAVSRKPILVLAHEKDSADLDPKVAGLGYDIIAEGGGAEGDAFAAVVHMAADPHLVVAKRLATRIPVVLLCDNANFEQRLAAARAGVRAVVSSPLDVLELGAWLKEFEQHELHRPSILIVDDDELAAEGYAAVLQSADMNVRIETDPLAAIAAIGSFDPDLVLLDVHMPDVNGVELASIVRQFRRNLTLPMIFLSAERDATQQQAAREIGGDDFIVKPVDPMRLTALVRMRAARAIALRQVMERDSLTGLLNHARFKDRLNSEVARARRSGAPIAFCLIDLDHFKRVNDTFGHQAGDRVIETLAYALRAGLRSSDVVGRYGGEEFGAILLDTTPENARIAIEKIRTAFAAIGFAGGDESFTVTFSAGLSGVEPESLPEDVIGAADAALYRAKAAGRNCVVVDQPGKQAAE